VVGPEDWGGWMSLLIALEAVISKQIRLLGVVDVIGVTRE